MEFAGDTTPPPPPPPFTTANLLKKIAAIACLLLVVTTIIFAITTLILFEVPRFQVKWASISLHNVSSFNNNNNFMTAKWNLALSVRNPSKAYAINYHDFGIKVNFFARYSTTLANYSSPTHVVPGFLQPRETTNNLVNVFVNATLPYYAIQPTFEDLEFEVIIKVKFKSSSVIFNLKLLNMDVFCNDMKIGIFFNATYGYFIGTPKSCSSDLLYLVAVKLIRFQSRF